MKSFLRLSAESRVKENNLLKIDRLIDWAQLRLVLKNIERSGLGPAGYDMLSLLKALNFRTPFEVFLANAKIPQNDALHF